MASSIPLNVGLVNLSHECNRKVWQFHRKASDDFIENSNNTVDCILRKYSTKSHFYSVAKIIKNFHDFPKYTSEVFFLGNWVEKLINILRCCR